MTIILVGPTCSGKTRMAKHLQRIGIPRIITYTTRPPRKGERDDIDYHFVSNETFMSLKDAGLFAETTEYETEFGHFYYGSSVESYRNGGVIALNPRGVFDVVKTVPKEKRYVVYLDTDFEVCKQRSVRRGDDPKEVERRLKADEKDFEIFDKSKLWDLRIHTHFIDDDDMEKLINLIATMFYFDQR